MFHAAARRRAVPALRRSAEDSNANGVASRSPGLARGTSAYPGLSSHIFPNNPNGVAASGFVPRGRNLDGVLESPGIVPQGSRSFVASTLGFETERPWRSQVLGESHLHPSPNKIAPANAGWRP